jgi:multicomponent Na+:H+ antiporter subunit C
MLEELLGRYTYFGTAILLVIGAYAMICKHNLVKKLIGMNILQTAVFLFFIGRATKLGATVPVIDPEVGFAPASYVNPLPHALILTAIVVGVATTGVALAILVTIYRQYGSLDERVIMERMRQAQ